MDHFLILHTTYETVEIAHGTASTIYEKIIIPKQTASALLLNECHKLLFHARLMPQSLVCIVVNQGPGPFTTLRTVIATANGLQFATGLPLVGVHALESLVQEQYTSAFPLTCALLNAFNNDVYYALSCDGVTTHAQGCLPIQEVLLMINQQFPQKHLCFVGNGAQLYQDEIRQHIGSYAYFPSPLPDTPSLEKIAAMGWQQWLTNTNIQGQLFPHYFKQHSATLGKRLEPR